MAKEPEQESAATKEFEPAITSTEEKQQATQIQSSVVSEGTVKEDASKAEKKEEKKKEVVS